MQGNENARAKKAIVVGAGLGGLAAAARLARQGWQVTVFDKRSGPGGKAFTDQRGGFRFDTGPSNLTMVGVFEDLFRFCGADFRQRVKITPLDPLCHYWFDDGTTFSLPGSVEGATKTLAGLGWADLRSLRNYFRHLKFLHDRAGTLFLERPLEAPSTWLAPAGLKGIVSLPFLDIFTSLDRMNRRFFQHPNLLQLLGRYATYNGSSPYQTPGILGIIPWVEYGLGGWGVDDGIYALPLAIERLGRELGVEYRYDTPVEQIVSEKGAVRGVRTSEGFFAADAVVSNADVLSTYRLLGDEEAPWARRYRTLEPSSSALVFTWGVRGSFPELGLHNIFFSRDYPREFSQIFQDHVVPEDPTIYVNISSKLTPSDAPEGQENWFVLINVPAHRGQDWAPLIDQAREAIFRRLEEKLGKSVRDLVVHEDVLDPPTIERVTGSTFGSLYGMSSNSMMSAFNRHPNRSRRHRGLWFVGGGAHPGAGMPLVLLSAKIATTELGSGLV